MLYLVFVHFLEAFVDQFLHLLLFLCVTYKNKEKHSVKIAQKVTIFTPKSIKNTKFTVFEIDPK